MTLLEEVIAAHGGAERWGELSRVRAQVRSGGLLLRTRVGGTRLAEGSVEVSTRRVWCSAGPFPESGQRGVLDGEQVRIETDDGEVLSSRERPRDLFFGRPGLRRNLRWDALDATYFAGYAWWNYINAPYLLAQDGFAVRELEPWRERRGGGRGETWRRLAVRFPAEIPTHSRDQVFYYDADLRLRRHDYVAEVVGAWARAAHYCTEHREVDGLVFPTRRRVVPRVANRPLPGPTLVSLAISKWQLS